GCSMCCTEPYLRDVGIIATKKGWSISFGGNGGSRPRIGDLLAQRLAEEEVVNQVKKALIFYCQKANRKERTARFIERFGIDRFKTEITK
nr:nitrite reductase [Desulfocapsaceae bacterium]